MRDIPFGMSVSLSYVNLMDKKSRNDERSGKAQGHSSASQQTADPQPSPIPPPKKNGPTVRTGNASSGRKRKAAPQISPPSRGQDGRVLAGLPKGAKQEIVGSTSFGSPGQAQAATSLRR